MKIEYDPDKNQRNIEERGISFEMVQNFDLATAKTIIDDRFDYDEVRYRSIGFIGARLYVLVWTPRKDALRVISLRKANKREVSYYVNESK